MTEPARTEPFILEHYKRYLVTSGTCKSPRSVRDYLLSVEMFSREAGDLLQIVEYRDFHWKMESLAARTQWPEGCGTVRRGKKVWGPRMVNKVSDELAVFYNWAHSFGYMKENPLKDGHHFKDATGRQPESFDWDDPTFKKILHDPNNTLRLSCMLHVLRGTGIRAEECANLKREDYTGVGFHIWKGKGGKYRFVGIDPEGQKFMTQYLKDLEIFGYTGPWLFPKEDYTGPVTAHGIWRLLYVRGRKLGVRVYPHKIRHSLPAELADRGMHLLHISEQMGHEDPRTTAHYTHIKKEKIEKSYREAFARKA